MKIVLRKETNIPYYKQIYMQIVDRIQSGMLSHGESLPSFTLYGHRFTNQCINSS